jgi:hypothetical protein
MILTDILGTAFDKVAIYIMITNTYKTRTLYLYYPRSHEIVTIPVEQITVTDVFIINFICILSPSRAILTD